MSITPRPSDKYWAATTGDALGAQVNSRFIEYLRELDAKGMIGIWNHVASVYYGYDPGTDSCSQWVSEAGEAGEWLNLHVNEFASLVRSQITLTTADRIAFEARASNDSPEAEAQAHLGTQVIGYYQHDGKLESLLVQACERMLLFGGGYVVQLWDAYAGPESGVEYVPEVDQDGNPVTELVEIDGVQVERAVFRERIVRAGDLRHRVYAPIDVARDLGCQTHDDARWFIIRERHDKYELAARYPEHSQYILSRPAYEADETARYSGTTTRKGEHTDQVHTLRLFHAKTEALPNGLESLVCGEKVLQSSPLAYERLPVHPMVSQEVVGRAIGYSQNFHLLGLQSALNQAVINGLTSSDAGSVPKWAVAKGSSVEVEDLGPNGRIIYYQTNPQAPGAGIPQLLATPQFSGAQVQQAEFFRAGMERSSGINSVVRGESAGKSGADNALIQAQAIAYQNGNVRAFKDCARSVGLGIIETLQRFATAERVLQVVGDDEAPAVAYFTGADLSEIRQVEVDMGDPVMRTMQGRKAVASELLERFPDKVTPEQYLAFMSTGRIEPMYKSEAAQVRLIRGENAKLSKGQPQPVLVSDCHLDHIKEHLAILSSPAVRTNEEITGAVLAHVAEHMRLWQAADPMMMVATGQAPPPMMPPPGAPMGPDGPGAPAPGPGPGGGDEPPQERAQVPGAPEEINGVAMPALPVNPMTGQQAG